MVEYGSWTEAWENWLEDDLTGCPYVMPLRTTVAADVTAAELFDCFRWFLLATSLGMLEAPAEWSPSWLAEAALPGSWLRYALGTSR